jgi:hypothetical protein
VSVGDALSTDSKASRSGGARIGTLPTVAQHVFVDESKARSYLLVAIAVENRDVDGLRKTMKSMLLKGQARVHFRKEQSARRRAVLSALQRIALDVTVIRSSGHDENKARDDCLAALATAIRWQPSSRLVIERDDSRAHADRQILRGAFQVLDGAHPRYDLMPPQAEPGLWAADAIAWALQRGNEWVQRVAEHDTHWIETDA